MKAARFPFLGPLDLADIARGRATDPVVRAVSLSHVLLETTDLDRAERFYRDFGLVPSASAGGAILFRAAGPAHRVLVVRESERSRFSGVALEVAGELDLRRLASLPGASGVEPIDEPGGGLRVRLSTPSGIEVHAVSGMAPLAPLAMREPIVHNHALVKARIGSSQRPPAGPAEVSKIGHVALESDRFFRDLLFWMRTFGLIVSDYQELEDEPSLGPVMAFLRCDRGAEPADHHTVALAAGIRAGLAHAAFEVQDLDAVAMGGEHLGRHGWRRAWGVGRHILGSQIFDYWRDPDGVMVEHYADGDVFDSEAPTGRLAFRGSHLAQWGPPLPSDFAGARPGPSLAIEVLRGLVGNDEASLRKLLATARALGR